MRKRKIIFFMAVTLVFILFGSWYYFFAINKDINGLTKKDVWQAEKTLISYINTLNLQEHDKGLTLLSKFYVDKKEDMQKMFELGSGIIYDDFQADYIEQSCKINLGYMQEREQYAEYIPGAKIVYFVCSFTAVARQEGSELGSGYTANMKYEEFGYYLVKEQGQWKILSWGY